MVLRYKQNRISNTMLRLLHPDSVDILILGAGWTSQFLLPLLHSQTDPKISYAATTTSGYDGTIPFRYESGSTDLAPYKQLPLAKMVLVTFPLVGKGQSRELVGMYEETHSILPAGKENSVERTRWVQLGAMTIWNAPTWNDRSSDYDRTNQRGVAEDELLELLGKEACVLDLAGLYDGKDRNPRNWVTRVAKTKEQVKAKGAVHLVHGEDVARAVLGVYKRFEKVGGKRWIVTDLRMYDWWDLFQDLGPSVKERVIKGDDPVVKKEDGEGMEYQKWVGELMVEEHVKALPRGEEKLGRKLDSREFWQNIGIWPSIGRPK